MDINEDCKFSSPSKLSKDLLYPDYFGSTVAEHVLKSLEKKSNDSRSEVINEFFEKKKRTPGAFERAKNVISMMNKHHESRCVEASADDKEAIEVECTIGGEASDSDINEYTADAWFRLPQSRSQELDSSEDEYGEKSSFISSPKANLLDFDDSSSDSSDDESLQNFSVSTDRKNLIEVIEDRCPDIDKSKLNFSVSTGKRKFCNNIQNDYSVESNDESSDGENSKNFFVSTKRKKIFNASESFNGVYSVNSPPIGQLFGIVKEMPSNTDKESSKKGNKLEKTETHIE